MPTPLELAEDYTYHVPPRPGFLRVVTDGWTLAVGVSGANVSRINLPPEGVAEARDDVRRQLRDLPHLESVTWWCGSRSTPDDLPEQLLELGLERDPTDPSLAVLELDQAPAGAPRAEVRRVETFDDFRVASEVDWEGSGSTPEAERQLRRARLPELWDAALAQGAVHYMGILDGEVVGYARAFFLDGAVLLMGASTLPAVRGRGVYVSLIHARWDDAVARGTPHLVVQAGAMSRPILERLGFRKLSEIQLLVDRL